VEPLLPSLATALEGLGGRAAAVLGRLPLRLGGATYWLPAVYAVGSGGAGSVTAVLPRDSAAVSLRLGAAGGAAEAVAVGPPELRAELEALARALAAQSGLELGRVEFRQAPPGVVALGEAAQLVSGRLGGAALVLDRGAARAREAGREYEVVVGGVAAPGRARLSLAVRGEGGEAAAARVSVEGGRAVAVVAGRGAAARAAEAAARSAAGALGAREVEVEVVEGVQLPREVEEVRVVPLADAEAELGEEAGQLLERLRRMGYRPDFAVALVERGGGRWLLGFRALPPPLKQLVERGGPAVPLLRLEDLQVPLVVELQGLPEVQVPELRLEPPQLVFKPPFTVVVFPFPPQLQPVAFRGAPPAFGLQAVGAPRHQQREKIVI